MFLKSLVAVVATAAATEAGTVAYLGLKPEDETKFIKAYDAAMKTFDFASYNAFLEDFKVGLKRYEDSKAFKQVPAGGHCDKGAAPSAAMQAAMNTKSVAAFPGGILKRAMGFDMSKMIFDLSQKAAGPASASGGLVSALAMQALAMGASQVQNIVSNAVWLIPPMIPPPFWNNQPLTCVPMLTGHNCFGAILHPITMSDFVIADVTDSALDGYIAGFPKMYLDKVGKTSDVAYKACFSSYMSMHCASLFPRCNAPQAREEPMPVGRVPMCFTHCLQTLVMCPGFWIDDIIGQCQDVAVPPQCTMAAYWNLWRAPPQYVSFEDSHGAPAECPSTLDTGAAGLDAGSEADLFENAGAGLTAGAAGAAARSLPIA